MLPLRALRPGLRRPLVARHGVTAQRNASTSSSSVPFGLRTGIYATAFLLSSGLFAIYYFDCRSALHRYILTPLLRYGLDAESGHKLAVKVLKSGLAPKDPVPDDVVLEAEIWGTRCSNPVGLAAGFDKDGEAIDGLFDLGFSWVEIGSVTPKPQPGNPRPRVFHLPEDDSLINRYGFPSQGHAAVVTRLRARSVDEEPVSEAAPASLRPGSLLSVNLGKNKESPLESVDDFVRGVQVFGPHADVLVINVSSPNTPGLRNLQKRSHLGDLLAGVVQARNDLQASSSRKPKLMLKLSPDLTADDVREIAEVVRSSGVDGVIVSNTTISRPRGLTHPNKTEAGGLSGPPLKHLSLAVLRTLRSNLPESIPIIGCGGITSGADALDYARAGASMVQIYTHFGYDGVGACRRIKDELSDILRREGTTWKEVVSRATSEASLKADTNEAKEQSMQQLIEEAEDLRKLLDNLTGKL
ncbi:dihydroorotate dehydrogenase [Punctularia strigosozonata HHB-11173 SS5]|uniref:Dihydroorotate dehydrogenase (quinone), mitochondrial n=1 Tax=Punctularia strigosozonata (strain HHB-11173) TaxID=741275 RepID=R7RZX2_PUNST|nr:dihydroorotate dehydrogenase [Punctularia strigosozonata HHB-11173 SS5]EIN03533.1 dihydroorotate dehydrogenase [Punctularia strigosozonata HHB-11173 SS5]